MIFRVMITFISRRWSGLVSISLALCVNPPSVRAQSAQEWIPQICFRPSSSQQAEVMSRPTPAGSTTGVWYVQKIENAQGPLCLDFHELTIERFPAVNGRPLMASEFLNWVRRSLPEHLAESPLELAVNGFADRYRWQSGNAAGATAIATIANYPAKAAMLLSEQTAGYFVLSAVRGGAEGMEHYPISGNRWIGMQTSDKEKRGTLFSRAAFRVAPSIAAADVEAAIAREEAIWTKFLENVKKMVLAHGGAVAADKPPFPMMKLDWDALRSTLHIPIVKWIDPEGNWESTDEKSRFRLEIKPGLAMCDFIERGAQGREIKRSLPLQASSGPDGGLFVERSNVDAEVLTFAGFSPEFQDQIIKAAARPSRLIFMRKGDTLLAKWEGIRVTKDIKGNLAAIREPGTSKAVPYTFAQRP
jgi:hypothetical protein